MKKITHPTIVAFVLVLPVLIAQDEIKMEDLFVRDSLYFIPGQDSVFSGKVTDTWENGTKKMEGSYKDGQIDGKRNTWYKNGQDQEESNWQLGIQNGEHKQWYENGHQKFERMYKEGVHDGKWSEWYENGQLMV